LAVGAWLVINQQSTPGIIIAGSILGARALAPVDLAIANWRGFVAARQGWQRLSKLLGHLPPQSDPMSLKPPARTLVVQNGAVAPPGLQKIVCQEVNFTLAAGKALGVIGPTASGKSSLARMLVGVWRPLRGTVRLDGATLDQWSSEALGRHIGYVRRTSNCSMERWRKISAVSRIRPIRTPSSPPPRRLAFMTSSSICPRAMTQ
jgi:ATP-binding cassette subfamily C protein